MPVAGDGRGPCHRRRIGQEVAASGATLEALLASHDVKGRVEASGPRQRHQLDIRVDDVHEADRAAAVLAVERFERWDRWTGGAARSFLRNATWFTLGRTDEVTTVVRVHWAPARRRGAPGRWVRPTAADWAAAYLPSALWWLYPFVHVVRAGLRRVGRRADAAESPGPYMATPRALVAPLLSCLEIGPNDTLVELGCGDGRIAVEAALRTGCRAIGVERDVTRVEQARRRVADAGVADRVTIIKGDARDADLARATVVVLFLPVGLVERLLPDLLNDLPAGASVLAHEQHALPLTLRPRPDRSELVIADNALTIAHVWTVR